MDKTGIEMIDADLAFFNYMHPEEALTFDELLDMIQRDKRVDDDKKRNENEDI